MRTLVTGASGFIGSRLIERCRAQGDEVTGTHAHGAHLPSKDEREADLLDLESLTRTVEEVDPEVIIHLGGLSHVGLSWKHVASYFQVNVIGTENLLRAADGRRVVFASSAEVYGKVPATEQPLTEDRVAAPRSPYAMSKAAAERICLERQAVVARAFNVVGPGQSRQFVLPSFADQLARIAAGTETSLKVGNLEAQRDFLHIDDAVHGFRTLAKRGNRGEVYNIGGGEVHSIRHLLDLLVEVSGVDATPEIDPERFRPVDIPLLRADPSRLTALGWSAERSLRQAVEEVWAEAVDRVTEESIGGGEKA